MYPINSCAESEPSALKTNCPPNHITITITIVLKNSLIGEDKSFFLSSLVIILLYSLLSFSKFLLMCFSALKAFIILSPDIFSSIIESKSPILFCPLSDDFFNDLPITPITNPVTGKSITTKVVSSGLIKISVIR